MRSGSDTRTPWQRVLMVSSKPWHWAMVTNGSSIVVCPDGSHAIQLYSSSSTNPVGQGVTLIANDTALFVTVSPSLIIRSP